jgi:nitric oxide reductase subunit C
MDASNRRRLVLALVGIFLAQTWLVYSDPTGRTAEPLSELADEGRAIWHRNNCQSCHQIYGYGGFLGPDLTNLASRVGFPEDSAARAEALDARLATALTTGSARMPVFHMQADQVRALGAYLTALDSTGVGQLVLGQVKTPTEVFDDLLLKAAALEALTPQEQAGRRIVEQSGCIGCHMPNARSTFKARCMTQIHGEVEAERLALVLAEGIPEKGMPRLGHTDERAAEVVAFLHYLTRHGADLRAGFERAERGAEVSLGNLPWFDYP